MRRDFDFDDAIRSSARVAFCGCAGVVILLIGIGMALGEAVL